MLMLLATLLLVGVTPAEDHPLVQIVLELKQADGADDAARVAAFHADDARIWFGEKTGEGHELDPGGGGPWSEWDRYFRSQSEFVEFDVATAHDRAVRVVVEEINDWFRLVERDVRPYRIIYYFDTNDRIEGKLIQAIPDQPKGADRLAEFERWATEKHPGLLDTLMPEGQIDPSRPRLWKKMLLAWRQDAGLPPIPGVTDR